MSDYLQMPAADLLEKLAAGVAAPAAGSAAALTAAMAAALVEMVAHLTVEKATVGSATLQARYGPFKSRAEEIGMAVRALRWELQALAQEDADLVEALVARRRQLEVGASSEVGSVSMARQEESPPAAQTPLRVARIALLVTEYAVEMRKGGYQSAAADSGTAVFLALAAAESALAVTAANLKGLPNDPQQSHPIKAEYAELLQRLALLRAPSHLETDPSFLAGQR